MSKIEQAKQLIEEWTDRYTAPAVMLSFGKDSMVMASLIRDTVKNRGRFPHVHHFPMRVIYHRDPWFPQKHLFANSIISSWSMEVHDWPPAACGIKVKDDMLELVARYPFGTTAIDIPKNIVEPEPRKDYICGLNDWLRRPKMNVAPYPFDCVFIGQKSSDVDQFEGHVPLKADHAEIGGVPIVFPLKDWTDDDVWDYIEQHHVPVPVARYSGREELQDKWLNNDYLHACTRCIDPRNPAMVDCPKLKQEVPNVSGQVLRLYADAEYIDRKAA